MSDAGSLLVALLGTGGFAALVGAWAGRRQAQASAEVTVSEAWSTVATRHEAEITGLKSEITCLRERVDKLVAERTELLVRITTLTSDLARERETSAALRCEVDTLKGRVHELEGRT